MAEDRDLLPGETEVLRVNRHPIIMVRRTAIPLVAGTLLLVGGAALPLKASGSTMRWFLLLALLIGVLVLLDIQYIVWRAETVTITDQRVLLRRGVFGRFSRSIGLGRVQDVSTHQGLFGRLLGYGTVEVESAARDGAEVLDHVPRPREFSNVLFERLGRVPERQPW